MKDSRKTLSSNLGKKRIFLKLSMTNLFILINIFCFLTIFPLGLSVDISYLGICADDTRLRQLWTIITYMFFHVHYRHLLQDMFCLFIFGNLTEGIIGKERYFWFYLVSGAVAGFIVSIFAQFLGSIDTSSLAARAFGNPQAVYLGSSGPLYAVVGLFLILIWRIKFKIGPLPSLPIYLLIIVPLFTMEIISIFKVSVARVYFGFPYFSFTGHLAGFLTGTVYGLYLRYGKRIKIGLDLPEREVKNEKTNDCFVK